MSNLSRIAAFRRLPSYELPSNVRDLTGFVSGQRVIRGSMYYGPLSRRLLGRQQHLDRHTQDLSGTVDLI